MSIAKNKKIWLGAGALGCLGMVMVGGFILVGGIALYAMSSTPAPAAPVRPPEGHGYAPDNGGQPGPAPAPVSATVDLEGEVVDAATGQGIGGAYFVVMAPGRTFADFQASNDPAGDGLLEMAAVTDGSGAYRLSDLTRGHRYTVLVAAPGYLVQAFDHGLEITANDPDVTRMNPIALDPEY